MYKSVWMVADGVPAMTVARVYCLSCSACTPPHARTSELPGVLFACPRRRVPVVMACWQPVLLMNCCWCAAAREALGQEEVTTSQEALKGNCYSIAVASAP